MNRKQHIILICLTIAIAACASTNLYIASKYTDANKVVLGVDAKIDSLEHAEAAFYYFSRNENRKDELFIKAAEGYSLSYTANVGKKWSRKTEPVAY